jgi:hypothetical protein
MYRALSEFDKQVLDTIKAAGLGELAHNLEETWKNWRAFAIDGFLLMDCEQAGVDVSLIGAVNGEVLSERNVTIFEAGDRARIDLPEKNFSVTGTIISVDFTMWKPNGWDWYIEMNCEAGSLLGYTYWKQPIDGGTITLLAKKVNNAVS